MLRDIGKCTDFKAVHPKAQRPIFCKESGKLIAVRLWQEQNAPAPISVTELGMKTLTKVDECENALLPIRTIVFGMTKVGGRMMEYSKALSGISVITRGGMMGVVACCKV